MNLLASVVIAYNERDMLELTLPPIKAISDQVIIVDMGSNDGSDQFYKDILGPRDLVVNYPRENLFYFGFSHPRNYGAKFASSQWILAVDCDELIVLDEVEAARGALERQVTVNSYSVERRNYVRAPSYDLSDLKSILTLCPNSIESHRRLYRHLPRVRFEGLVHEEIWDGEVNAHDVSEKFPLTLHHLNQFKPDGTEYTKIGLYSYLTLKAIIYPAMRFGTNKYWFTEFAKQNFGLMTETMHKFVKENGVPDIDIDLVVTKLEEEGFKPDL